MSKPKPNALLATPEQLRQVGRQVFREGIRAFIDNVDVSEHVLSASVSIPFADANELDDALEGQPPDHPGYLEAPESREPVGEVGVRQDSVLFDHNQRMPQHEGDLEGYGESTDLDPEGDFRVEAGFGVSATVLLDQELDRLSSGDLALRQQLEQAARALFAEGFEEEEVVAELASERQRLRVERMMQPAPGDGRPPMLTGADVVGTTDRFWILRIQDFAASKQYGNTAWCVVRDPRVWESYAKQGIQFFYYVDKSKGLPAAYALAVSDEGISELYDAQDKLMPCFLSHQDTAPVAEYLTEDSRATFENAEAWKRVIADPNTSIRRVLQILRGRAKGVDVDKRTLLVAALGREDFPRIWKRLSAEDQQSFRPIMKAVRHQFPVVVQLIGDGFGTVSDVDIDEVHIEFHGDYEDELPSGGYVNADVIFTSGVTVGAGAWISFDKRNFSFDLEAYHPNSGEWGQIEGDAAPDKEDEDWEAFVELVQDASTSQPVHDAVTKELGEYEDKHSGFRSNIRRWKAPTNGEELLRVTQDLDPDSIVAQSHADRRGRFEFEGDEIAVEEGRFSEKFHLLVNDDHEGLFDTQSEAIKAAEALILERVNSALGEAAEIREAAEAAKSEVAAWTFDDEDQAVAWYLAFENAPAMLEYLSTLEESTWRALPKKPPHTRLLRPENYLEAVQDWFEDESRDLAKFINHRYNYPKPRKPKAGYGVEVTAAEVDPVRSSIEPEDVEAWRTDWAQVKAIVESDPEHLVDVYGPFARNFAAWLKQHRVGRTYSGQYIVGEHVFDTGSEYVDMRWGESRAAIDAILADPELVGARTSTPGTLTIEGVPVEVPNPADFDKEWLAEQLRRIRQAGFGRALDGLTLTIQSQMPSYGDFERSFKPGGLYEADEDRLTISTDNNPESTLTHEIGHRYYYRVLENNARADWNDRIERTVAPRPTKDFAAMLLDVMGIKDRDVPADPHALDGAEAAIDAAGDRYAENALIAMRAVLPYMRSAAARANGETWAHLVFGWGFGGSGGALPPKLHLEPISEYAAKSPVEAFAEAFAQYVIAGPAALRPWTRGFFERLTHSTRTAQALRPIEVTNATITGMEKELGREIELIDPSVPELQAVAIEAYEIALKSILAATEGDVPNEVAERIAHGYVFNTLTGDEDGTVWNEQIRRYDPILRTLHVPFPRTQLVRQVDLTPIAVYALVVADGYVLQIANKQDDLQLEAHPVGEGYSILRYEVPFADVQRNLGRRGLLKGDHGYEMAALLNQYPSTEVTNFDPRFGPRDAGFELVAGRLENVKQKYPGHEAVVDALSAADPSKANKYLEWMAAQVIGEGQDQPFIIDLVRRYHAQVQRLPPEYKDINRLDAFTVEWAVDRMEKQKTHKERGQESAAGANLLTKTPTFSVYEITNKEASCALGRGTRWCITMSDQNHFENYTEKGVRFFFVIQPDGTKHAVAASKDQGALEIYDAQDNLVLAYDLPEGSLDFIYQHLGYTQEAARGLEQEYDKTPLDLDDDAEALSRVERLLANPYTSDATIDHALQALRPQGSGSIAPGLLKHIATRQRLTPLMLRLLKESLDENILGYLVQRPDIAEDDILDVLNDRTFTWTTRNLMGDALRNRGLDQARLLAMADNLSLDSKLAGAKKAGRLSEDAWRWFVAPEQLEQYESPDAIQLLEIPGRPEFATRALLALLRGLGSSSQAIIGGDIAGEIPGDVARDFIENTEAWSRHLTSTSELSADEAIDLTLEAYDRVKDAKDPYRLLGRVDNLVHGILLREDLTPKQAELVLTFAHNLPSNQRRKMLYDALNDTTSRSVIDLTKKMPLWIEPLSRNPNLTSEDVEAIWRTGSPRSDTGRTLAFDNILISQRDKLTPFIIQDGLRRMPVEMMERVPDLLPTVALNQLIKSGPGMLATMARRELGRRGKKGGEVTVMSGRVIGSVLENGDEKLRFMDRGGYVFLDADITVEVVLSDGTIIQSPVQYRKPFNSSKFYGKIMSEPSEWVGMVAEIQQDETLRNAIYARMDRELEGHADVVTDEYAQQEHDREQDELYDRWRRNREEEDEEEGYGEDFSRDDGDFDPEASLQPWLRIAFILEAGRIDDVKATFPGEEAIVDQLAAADPSKGRQKYLAWMAQAVIGEGHPQDQVIQAASDFEKNFQRIPGSARDISKLTFQQVVDLIANLGESKVEKKREVKQQGTKEILRTPEYTLLEMLTRDAVCTYGAGTKWCITERSGDTYDSYKKGGVRFFYVLTKDAKYAIALHATGVFEIFDAEDSIVDIRQFEEMFPGVIDAVFGSSGIPKADMEKTLTTELNNPRTQYERRAQLVQHPYMPIESILAYVQKGAVDSADIVVDMLKNPRVRPEHVLGLLSNESTDPRVIYHLSQATPFPDVIRMMADGTSFPPAVQREFAHRQNRHQLAKNPNTPPDVLQRYLVDPAPTEDNGGLRAIVLENPNATEEMLRSLVNDPSSYTLRTLAESKRTPPDILTELASKRGADVRSAIAGNPSAPPELLQRLAEEAHNFPGKWSVMGRITYNPNAPRSALEFIVQHGDHASKARAKMRLEGVDDFGYRVDERGERLTNEDGTWVPAHPEEGGDVEANLELTAPVTAVSARWGERELPAGTELTVVARAPFWKESLARIANLEADVVVEVVDPAGDAWRVLESELAGNARAAARKMTVYVSRVPDPEFEGEMTTYGPGPFGEAIYASTTPKPGLEPVVVRLHRPIQITPRTVKVHGDNGEVTTVKNPGSDSYSFAPEGYDFEALHEKVYAERLEALIARTDISDLLRLAWANDAQEVHNDATYEALEEALFAAAKARRPELGRRYDDLVAERALLENEIENGPDLVTDPFDGFGAEEPTEEGFGEVEEVGPSMDLEGFGEEEEPDRLSEVEDEIETLQETLGDIEARIREKVESTYERLSDKASTQASRAIGEGYAIHELAEVLHGEDVYLEGVFGLTEPLLLLGTEPEWPEPEEEENAEALEEGTATAVTGDLDIEAAFAFEAEPGQPTPKTSSQWALVEPLALAREDESGQKTFAAGDRFTFTGSDGVMFGVRGPDNQRYVVPPRAFREAFAPVAGKPVPPNLRGAPARGGPAYVPPWRRGAEEKAAQLTGLARYADLFQRAQPFIDNKRGVPYIHMPPRPNSTLRSSFMIVPPDDPDMAELAAENPAKFEQYLDRIEEVVAEHERQSRGAGYGVEGDMGHNLHEITEGVENKPLDDASRWQRDHWDDNFSEDLDLRMGQRGYGLMIEASKTLWHGTSIDIAKQVKAQGLIPQVGAWVRDSYGTGMSFGEGEDTGDDPSYGVDPRHYEVTFAADDATIGGAVGGMGGAVAAKLGKAFHDVTADDVFRYGALLKIETDAGSYTQRPPRDTPEAEAWDREQSYYRSGDPELAPPTVEPGDWWTREETLVDEVLTGQAMVDKLTALGEWPPQWTRNQKPTKPKRPRKRKSQLGYGLEVDAGDVIEGPWPKKPDLDPEKVEQSKADAEETQRMMSAPPERSDPIHLHPLEDGTVEVSGGIDYEVLPPDDARGFVLDLLQNDPRRIVMGPRYEVAPALDGAALFDLRGSPLERGASVPELVERYWAKLLLPVRPTLKPAHLEDGIDVIALLELTAGRLENVKQKYPGREAEVDALAAQDPSGQNKYLEWMAKWVIGEGNGADYIVPIVQRYHAQLQRLPKEFRDITKLDPFGAEWAVERAEGTKTHQQTRTEVQEGAPLIAETPEFKIYEIKNKEASCALGRGTKWCITMKNEEHYEDYVAQGVRFFFIMQPDGTKHAVAVYPDFGAIEVYDAQDNYVSPTVLPPGSIDLVFEHLGYSRETAEEFEQSPPVAGPDFVSRLQAMVRHPYSSPEGIDRAFAVIQHLPPDFQGLDGMFDMLPEVAARPVLGPIARAYLVKHGSEKSMEIFLRRPDITRDEIDDIFERGGGRARSTILAMLDNPALSQSLTLDTAQRVGYQNYVLVNIIANATLDEDGWKWVVGHLHEFHNAELARFLQIPKRPREVTEAILGAMSRLDVFQNADAFEGDFPGDVARRLIEEDPKNWAPALTQTSEIPVDEAVDLVLAQSDKPSYKTRARNLVVGLLRRPDLTDRHIQTLIEVFAFPNVLENAISIVSRDTSNPAVIDAAIDMAEHSPDEHNYVAENKNLNPEQVARLWIGPVQRDQHTTVNARKFLSENKDKLSREIVQSVWTEDPKMAVAAIPDLIPASALQTAFNDPKSPYPLRRMIADELTRRGQETTLGAPEVVSSKVDDVELDIDFREGEVKVKGHITVDVALSNNDVIGAGAWVSTNDFGSIELEAYKPRNWAEPVSWKEEEFAEELIEQIKEACTSTPMQEFVEEKVADWKMDHFREYIDWEEIDSGDDWAIYIGGDPFEAMMSPTWYMARTDGRRPNKDTKLKDFDDEDNARSYALDLADNLKSPEDDEEDEDDEEKDEDDEDDDEDLDRDAGLEGFGVLLAGLERTAAGGRRRKEKAAPLPGRDLLPPAGGLGRLHDGAASWGGG